MQGQWADRLYEQCDTLVVHVTEQTEYLSSRLYNIKSVRKNRTDDEPRKEDEELGWITLQWSILFLLLSLDLRDSKATQEYCKVSAQEAWVSISWSTLCGIKY